MKTATIDVQPMWCTKGMQAAVLYRGKLLYDFAGLDANQSVSMARKWAHAQGFTHCKVVMGRV